MRDSIFLKVLRSQDYIFPHSRAKVYVKVNEIREMRKILGPNFDDRISRWRVLGTPDACSEHENGAGWN